MSYVPRHSATLGVPQDEPVADAGKPESAVEPDAPAE